MIKPHDHHNNVYLWAIDTETTIDEKYGPAPQFSGNKAVYLGGKLYRTDSEYTSFKIWKGDFHDRVAGSTRVGFPIIAGHNIKFDLLYLMKDNPNFIKMLVENGTLVWDTQLAAYLNSGQQDSMISLDDLSAQHGLKLKDSKISDYFKDGIGADKIDPDEIKPYLRQDVENTGDIAVDQLAKLPDEKLPLYQSQMDALLAITEMEWNGMCIDSKRLVKAERDSSSDAPHRAAAR